MTKTESTETMLVPIPAEEAKVAALFTSRDQIDGLISRIEKEVQSHAPDLSNTKGREAVRALAAKVARSKVALDTAGKKLTEGWRAKTAAVNAERKHLTERLDEIRDMARKPLTDWEAEQERLKAERKARLETLEVLPEAGASSATIRALRDEIAAIEIDDTWHPDDVEEAKFAKESTLAIIARELAASEKREADAAELERLREDQRKREAEEAERVAKEQAEQAERDRRQRQAEEEVAAARREAEQARREAEEAKRQAEAAEAERIEAIRRQKQEAEAMAAREKQRKIEEEERERQRIADEEERERQREESRKAAKAKVAKCQAEIISALASGKNPAARAQLLTANQIPHMSFIIGANGGTK